MKKHKVLIIKTGYSEILDGQNNSRIVSLGDIVRTTPLLHLYKKDYVTWVTDSKAFPLLEGLVNQKYIHNLLPFDPITLKQLEKERFDTLINLEKIPGICALADDINAWKKYGFRFDSDTGLAEAYDKAFEILAVGSNPKSKKENKRPAVELMFELVGEKWNKEEYLLGYNPKSKERYDIAFNTQVGSKWPNKAWPKKYWSELESLLKKEGFSISKQEDQHTENDLKNYIEWINSCKTIITTDSLGLHLGIALKKRVIGLFGPTPSSEVFFYNNGKALLPENIPKCLPCFKGICTNDKFCLDYITPEKVYEEIKNGR
jgi:heptosyltransferase II